MFKKKSNFIVKETQENIDGVDYNVKSWYVEGSEEPFASLATPV